MNANFNAADAILQPAIGQGFADKPALIWRDLQVGYGDLYGRVSQAANLLVRRGLKPDDRVVLLLKDSPDFVAAYLGAIKAGGVAVALNLRVSADELAAILEDSAARFLIIDDEFGDLYRSIADRLPTAPDVIEADTGADAPAPLRRALEAEHRFHDTVERDLNDMAFWIYTSGTTGRPKAAVHCHKDVLIADAYLSRVMDVGPDDVLFATTKLFFAYALGTCLFGAFQLGATTVLHDAWPVSEAVAEIVDRHRPSIVFSVPTLYRNLLNDGVVDGPGFQGVRHYVSAGERLPPSLWKRWQVATGVAILDGMGTSETIYMLLTNTPDEIKPGSSGKPAPEAELRLLDDSGRPVAPGTPGVMWARIPSRAAAYWNEPEKSAATFVDDWFRTGDMYVVDEDGYWHHQGRADDMLKVSGQWVSPAEIEDVALTDAAIREVALVATETADELTRTTLFVVGPDEPFDPAALESRLRDLFAARLSPYKCPKWIRFVDRIPRTATGKVQRYKLRRESPGQY